MTFKSNDPWGGWWLKWRITLCKLLYPGRFTSVSSCERFPNCLLSGKHPAKLATTDSSLVIQIYWVHIVNKKKNMVLLKFC